MLSNLVIFKTLTLKETRRFLKVYQQTIISPTINSLIFFFIFKLATGNTIEVFSGMPYKMFVGTGIIVMAMMQQTFANSSSSITISKVHGNFIDYMITPISPNVFITSFTISSALRGILVGICSYIVILFFVDLQIYSITFLIFSSLAGAVIIAIMGIICGIVSQNFEQMSSFNTYFIMPLSFLSGTFYSINKLPSYLVTINMFNPFFQVIDTFRYSLTGYSESNPINSLVMLLAYIGLLYLIAYRMLKTGYRVKN